MAIPLADRIRPKTLDDVVGQEHLIAPGKPHSGNRPHSQFDFLWAVRRWKNHHCPHSGRPNGHDIT